MHSRLRDTLDFVEKLQKHTKINSAWDAFLAYAGQFGFSQGGLADMPRPGERLQDTILCLSWPTGWSKRYFEQNYIASDPARLHLKRSVEPFSWREMTDCDAYTKKQKTIVYEASEFRMKSGIIFPMPGLNSGPAMVTVAGENTDPSDQDRINLHLAAIYTHVVIRKLSDARPKTPLPSISPRERECILWHAAGKSDWDMGVILSISEKTANTYLERAKRKFGVTDRKQLIVAAMRSGIIQ
jgi:LuxR family quorum sensing-dependent transcriptional regulator